MAHSYNIWYQVIDKLKYIKENVFPIKAVGLVNKLMVLLSYKL